MILTVVIPVYQSEDTLCRCVESVMRQDVDSMEVILVDDGSTDGSPSLCDKWSTQDRRIHVVHRPNGGLSAARNTGIEIAQGRYITFVDADDYLDDSTFSVLLDLCKIHPEYDIVEYPALLFEGASKSQILSFPDTAYTSIKAYWDTTKAYSHTYACNKLFKTSLFKHIRFPEGRVFEDIYTFPLLLQEATVVATCQSGLYHYCYNPKGITNKAGATEWRMLLDAHLRIVKMPIFQPLSEDYCVELLNIQIYTNELTGDSPRIPPLHFHSVRTLKIILYQVIGIKALCKINRIFRTMVKRH